MHLTNLSIIGDKYHTDKNCSEYNSHCYTEIYDGYFQKFKNIGRKVKILEIGVMTGEDLLMINEYFNGECEIYGLDIDLSKVNYKLPNNFHFDQLDATDDEMMDKWYQNYHKPLFDIIIDDGSHQSYQIIKSLLFLYDKLTHDGIYIIEDLHATHIFDSHDYLNNSILMYLNFYNNMFDLDLSQLTRSIKSCIIYHNMSSYNRYRPVIPSNDLLAYSACAILQFKS